jgi:hypothetical protein
LRDITLRVKGLRHKGRQAVATFVGVSKNVYISSELLMRFPNAVEQAWYLWRLEQSELIVDMAQDAEHSCISDQVFLNMTNQGPSFQYQPLKAKKSPDNLRDDFLFKAWSSARLYLIESGR